MAPEGDLLSLISCEARSNNHGLHRRSLGSWKATAYPVNQPVLDYLFSDWLLQDALDCVYRILFEPSKGPDEKEWALGLVEANLPRM